ncbi:MAG: hypothetical protein CMM15_02475 [Rhodospirillaceae bacterium]|nr:hypothetical protein [Rhodospirillaceae bacterium]
MCNGNCGKCKKAEFETTDVQVESLAERSGMIVDDIKIGMTDGDDSQELQPTCMRSPNRDLIINRMTEDLDDFLDVGGTFNKRLANYLYERGWRK